MKRTPLRSKRPTPRRTAPERVRQTRLRPKAGSPPTAEEKVHRERVRALGCVVRNVSVIDSHRCAGRDTIHHPTAPITGGRVARSHQRVICLCEKHHQIQHGPRESVEALSHRGFWLVYGIDLLAEAERLWKESEGDF